VLKDLEPADFAALYRYACALGHDAGFLSLRGEPSAAQELRFLAGRLDEIEAGRRVSLILLHDGEIAGMAEVLRDQHPMKAEQMGWLALSVAPGRRGQGHGTTLLRAAIEVARERLKLPVLLLHVWGQNEGAMRLYRAHGFEECGRKPSVIRHPTAGKVDEITMMRRLA
jgi:putative acetyltransferase